MQPQFDSWECEVEERKADGFETKVEQISVLQDAVFYAVAARALEIPVPSVDADCPCGFAFPAVFAGVNGSVAALAAAAAAAAAAEPLAEVVPVGVEARTAVSRPKRSLGRMPVIESCEPVVCDSALESCRGL